MTPKDVFEEQPFSLSCRSVNTSEARNPSIDMKYRLYKDKKHLTDRHFFKTLASKDSSGSYYCEAEAKGIIKASLPLVINVKGKQTI